MNENNMTGAVNCWFGNTSREGCDKYKDGKCTGIVHPTYPPKLADCPFAAGEPCDKWKIGEADHDRQEDPTAMENAYKTVSHLAKVISSGSLNRWQKIHVVEAMLSACRSYVDADASDRCGPNTGKQAEGRHGDDGYAEDDHYYCPYRDDHECRHSHHVCAYCGENASSAWRPEGVPLSEMPEEARRICEDFDRKAAEAANGAFAAEDKANNKENGK